MNTTKHTDRESQRIYWNTVVIGAGQAGLATGYYLKKYGEEFIIIDESDRIGNSWRKDGTT